MNVQSILKPVADDMRAVDTLIRTRLDSDVVLIRTLGEYIIGAGGKRLRPALVLLVARACGYEGDRHFLLATLIEFIHTATLLHDDVVDESDLRRGRRTANQLWGNGASVLTGDFLYTRAFQMMVELEDPVVMRVLAQATNRIAEGEVMQLMHSHNPDLTEADYFDVIDRKTASLFAAGCRLAAVLAGSDSACVAAMESYGRNLGTAFQIIDDALDYGRGDSHYGKNSGDDLAEGKSTLPLIHAMQKLPRAEAAQMRAAIREGDVAQLDFVMQAIESTGAMTYTCARAEAAASAAIQCLDWLQPSPNRDALIALAEFSAARRH
ncbi:MAG TPA: polyprenyl synthetase family protein [Salinisphaeraceae bacterium]|nr:polyprenyl synthetase family protein [Salinisphaeraceae bacterium]